MTLIVATLLLFAAGPFVLWPLIRTPDESQVPPTPALVEHPRPGTD
jgi:hypothetical protein